MSAQRQLKEEKVAQLQETFTSARIVVVAHYAGSSVKALSELREALASTQGKLQITKNKLALRAIEGTDVAAMKDLFTGPTAIVTSSDEDAVTALPKVLVDFGKKHENIKLLGGAMDGAKLEESEVRNLASLPSKNDLRAKLIGLITQPASKIITILNQPSSKIARVLNARVAAEEK